MGVEEAPLIILGHRAAAFFHAIKLDQFITEQRG